MILNPLRYSFSTKSILHCPKPQQHQFFFHICSNPEARLKNGSSESIIEALATWCSTILMSRNQEQKVELKKSPITVSLGLGFWGKREWGSKLLMAGFTDAVKNGTFDFKIMNFLVSVCAVRLSHCGCQKGLYCWRNYWILHRTLGL